MSNLNHILDREYKNSLFQLIYQENGEKSKQCFADLMQTLINDKETSIEYTKLDRVKLNYPLLERSKHDVAYWYDGRLLVMTEHQSSFCENITLRYLMYIARAYEKWVNEMKFEKYLYKGKFPKKLPTPMFIVLYNGKKDLDFDKKYKLSSLFNDQKHDKILSALELMVQYIDIRHDNVKIAYKDCKSLYEYSRFVAMHEEKAPIEQVIRSFSEDSILGEILRKEGILNMIKTEFEAKTTEEIIREAAKVEWFEEGLEKGRIFVYYEEMSLSPEQIAAKLKVPISYVEEILGVKNL